MRISNEGIALIKRFEGLELEAYRDAVGILTIGYGHTGDDVYEGQVITEAEAEAILRRDLDRFEVAVNEGIRVDTAQSMFDAFVSLSFNIGSGAFKKSTALKRHNKKDYTGAAEAITWWNKAGGQVLGGLVRRRAAEEALYLDGLDEVSDDLERASNNIEENSPRRSNPVTTRTTAGAGTAGAAGATGAGAVLLDDDEGTGESETETQDTTGETDDTPDSPTDSETDTGDTRVETDTDPVDTDTDAPTADADYTMGEADPKLLQDDTETDDGTSDTPVDVTVPSDEPTDETEGVEDSAPYDVDETTLDDSDSLSTDDPELPGDDDAPEDSSEVPVETDDITEDPASDTIESTEAPADGGMFEDFTKEDKTDAIVILAGIIAVIAAVYTIGARIDDWFKYRR